jgi:hypothetical protein
VVALRSEGGSDAEGAERGDARHPVGDRVVHLHEQADASVRQPGQEPQLPQRPRPVQPPVPQLLTGQQQPRLISRSSQREHPDVLGEIDRRRVDPQRPAQPEPRPVQQLPEAGNQVEPAPDLLAGRLDPEAAVGV